MTTRDLQVGDWISFHWISYKLYVVQNDKHILTVSSPSWSNTDSMTFKHVRFDNKITPFKYLGKSKHNPLYNHITRKIGFTHPYILNTNI